MRVTAGADRGRKLAAPRGATTRPTSAKVREAIFAILGSPPSAPVLDLYAGTGSMAIEALSRGAVAATFVERDPRALASLNRNLRTIGLAEKARVIGADVGTALRRLDRESPRSSFAWIFVDPPYASGEVPSVVSFLASSALLTKGAVIIVEHDRHNVPSDAFQSLILSDRRYYGDTGVSFYRREGGQE